MTSADSAVRFIEDLNQLSFTVEEKRCVRVRNRNASCSRCMDVCPGSCISVENNVFKVDSVSCVNCGACIGACPTGVFELPSVQIESSVEKTLASVELSGGRGVFLCKKIASQAINFCDPEKVTVINCLAQIDESFLVRLSVLGAKRLSLVHGDCDSCQLQCGEIQSQTVVANVREMLQAWQIPTDVRVSAKIPAAVRKAEEAEFDISKRGFLKDAAQNLTSVARTAAQVALEDKIGAKARLSEEPPIVHVLEGTGTIPYVISPARARLLSALNAAGNPEDVLVRSSCFGFVDIDYEACTSCTMCATFCPTGALSKTKESDGVTGLAFSPALCTQCGCCQDICLSHAITLYPEVFARDISQDFVEPMRIKPLARKTADPLAAQTAMRNIFKGVPIYDYAQ